MIKPLFYASVILLALNMVSGSLPICLAQERVELQCDELTESSGLAVSKRNPQIVWSHNDSGDTPRLFAFTRDGKWIGEVRLDGIKAIDWEDMCSFQRDGKNYLAVGDIGDNSRKRKSIAIYVFEEPKLEIAKLEIAKQPEQLTLSEFQKVEVIYADGPVDCEALAYDPKLDQFLLASKELLRCRLYTLPAQVEATVEPIVAMSQQSLTLPMATAADISSDGQQLVIATYGPACLVRRGVKDGDGWDLSNGALKFIPLPPRKQGESICFTEDNAAVLLSSEFAPSPLWKVKLVD